MLMLYTYLNMKNGKLMLVYFGSRRHQKIYALHTHTQDENNEQKEHHGARSCKSTDGS